ncbi:tyramine beta-hydroxylase-like [Watersipora subatra]|uniref:tyramine beta-hydroxylase-like n=1 Tax=Watersipora subatra TaxID=2589382 RepID=UPI00355B4D37
MADGKHGLPFFLLVIVFASGHKFLQTYIPNGERVSSPCDDSVWEGVGHLHQKGGGERNSFGKVFEAEGNKWTEKLCREDSDGDGRSNGEELGDPNCVWSFGKEPTYSQNITHPGICEPLNSTKCSNATFECPKAWSCPAINQPDVKTISITTPSTSVPARPTTYICYNKKIPSDQLYDIVASTTVINNTNVLHHMTVYGCNGDLPDGLDGTLDDCSMRNEKCSKILHIWTVGLEDFCQADYKAFRFGKGLTTWVAIQYHWNNPQLRTDYKDASGVQLFYTPKLRPYAEDIFQTGDGAIYIPPNSKDFKVTGLCSHDCSKRSFAKPFNITSILLHMHGTGVSMWAKQYRNGELLRVLAEDNPYHYTTPVIHRFEEEPIEFRPGDELKVECTFDTTGNNNWVINGPGTMDEMCVTLISYYPANEFFMEDCFSVKGRCGKGINDIAPGCNYRSLMPNLNTLMPDIRQHCDINEGNTCPSGCADIFRWIKYLYPNCFQNQPKAVSNFIWASLLPTALEGPSQGHFVNAFKGCVLYSPNVIRSLDYHPPLM